MIYLLACVLLWQIHAAPMPDCMVCNELGSTCSVDEHCCDDMICAETLSGTSTCVVPVSCTDGLMKVNNQSPPKAFCCHKDCVVCGGPSCGTDPLGAANCCGGTIEENGRVCGEVDGPPCMYSDAEYAQCKTDVDRTDMDGPNTSCSVDADCCKGYTCDSGACAYYETKTDACCPSGGLMDGLGRTCCDSGCLTCGGSSCGTRPGGAYNCCSGTIMANAKPLLCNTNNATPCIMESSFCATGVVNPTGEYCCDSQCGTCGGAGCASRPGGDICCASYIDSAFGYCSHAGDITCKVPKYCMDGIVNEENTICCPASCGTCGGASCSTRPGGVSSCCGAGISSTCSSFTDTACNLPWAV